MKQGQRITTFLVHGLLWGWSLVCLFPLYWLAVTSLKPGAAIDEGPAYLPFIDFVPSLDAWRHELFDHADGVGLAFFNSITIDTMATGLCVAAAAMIIYGLTRLSPVRTKWLGPASNLLPGNTLVWIMATRLLPPVAITIPLYVMAQWAGLLDTRTMLVIVYAAVNLPVAIWLLRPVLGTRASEQEEAALLDGASQFEIFATIVLPMARAGIIAVALLVFVLCWNEYLFAAYLATDHAVTLPVQVVSQLSMKEAQVGGGPEELANFSAAATLMAAPVMVITLVIQRHLSRLGIMRES